MLNIMLLSGTTPRFTVAKYLFHVALVYCLGVGNNKFICSRENSALTVHLFVVWLLSVAIMTDTYNR